MSKLVAYINAILISLDIRPLKHKETVTNLDTFEDIYGVSKSTK